MRGHRDPGSPEGYSSLGIAKINGIRVAINVLENGARLDDVAGAGRGFADVFDGDGHLIRRFTFRENLNSPPQIIEYVSVPPAVSELTQGVCREMKTTTLVATLVGALVLLFIQPVFAQTDNDSIAEIGSGAWGSSDPVDSDEAPLPHTPLRVPRTRRPGATVRSGACAKAA